MSVEKLASFFVGGEKMSSIQTSINLNDGMTSVLNSMYAGVNHLLGGFRNMQNTVGRGFNTSAFNGFREHMSNAIAQMGLMEREARRVSQNVSQSMGQAINGWRRTFDFNVFGGSADERFKSEVNEITKQMQAVLTQQEHIKRKALGMELLPRSAVSDIVEADNKVKMLISDMQMLKNIDITFFSKGQKNNINAEYENLRKNVIAIMQLQRDMNTSAANGDVSGVNAGFNQIKSIVEQTEMRLRSFKETLGQINSSAWQSIGGAEIINTTGLMRATQEIDTLKNAMNQLTLEQNRLSANTSNVKMLPSNAVSEIDMVRRRLENVKGSISLLENEKNKLKRWDTAGINQFNSRIEELRQRMFLAEQAQRNINQAIQENDVGRLNEEYRKLNAIIDGIERDIRDNGSAQQQFNNGIGEGSLKAGFLKRQLNGVTNILSRIKMYAATAFAGFGLKSGLEAVDTYANLSSRLGLITKSFEEQLVLSKRLNESAQKTGSSYTDMASVTAKLGLLSGKAFNNNAELLKFSELMSKSFKVSGASTQEQQAGMYQLTQAMASGRLQGDEFRSIIENAPMLAQAIATYTGKGMESLKEMSREGSITADVIKNALFMAGSDIEKKFAEIPKTFSLYWTEIKNVTYQEFGGLMQIINNAINTESFSGFIEKIKTSIGSAAEWVTLRFYEFKILFVQLWNLAQPAFQAISTGFVNIRNYIFSANGVLGNFIKTLSKMLSSSGFSAAVQTLTDIFINLIGTVSYLVQGFMNLISTFDWFGSAVVRVIAFVKIYNTVNGIAQRLAGTLSNLTSMLTGRMNVYTATVNGATVAQRGLNAAMRANPFGVVAQVVSLLISLFSILSSKIDEVNEKAGGGIGETDGIKIRSPYDKDVREYAKKHGITPAQAAQVFSERDAVSAKIKEERAKNKKFKNIAGITKAQERAKAYEDAVAAGKQRETENGTTYVVVSGFGKITEEQYRKANRMADKVDSLTTKNEKEMWEQYETEKWNMVNGFKNQNKTIDDLDDKYDDWFKNLNFEPYTGGGGGDEKTDVGTVDKIKDTVDVTDEDLKFMRDFAERDIINKIHTTQLAPQINVEFKGDSSNPFDVNEMIGRVADELVNVVNNTAQGVHI